MAIQIQYLFQPDRIAMVSSTKEESLYFEGHVEHELAAVYTVPAISSATADVCLCQYH